MVNSACSATDVVVLMSTREPLVRNISETALAETERPDAVFRDPFARRFAGERGDQIAKSMPFSKRATWAWITRTYASDEFIKQQVGDGIDMVVNLAARSRCASLANEFAKKDHKK